MNDFEPIQKRRGMNEFLLSRGVLRASPLTSEFGGHPNSVLAATFHVVLNASAGKKRVQPLTLPE
ncbi:hypothetical protein [Paenibacillus sp. J5C2022]|uniref:hypothetical protein n=1 Tax=Paenibacillus sp. J5C2022 TaxID=2977129 RepID=UPI0021CEADD1|nr:hypothetical protein [Paenibacillus sp. J5C2022]